MPSIEGSRWGRGLKDEDAGGKPRTKLIQEWGYSIRHPSPLYYVHGNVYLHMASTYIGVKVVHVIYTKVLEDRGKVHDNRGATTATKGE